MAFEKYEGQGKSGRNFVSITTTKGVATAFYLSVSIARQLGPGLKYAQFYFDHEQKRVAIHFLDAKPTGYFIILQDTTRGTSVPCRAFCRHYGIKHQRNIPAKFEDRSDHEQWLVFAVEVEASND